MSSSFSSDAAAAFGRRNTGGRPAFNNSASAAFSRDQRQPAEQRSDAFAAFSRPASRTGFGQNAASAFGKATQNNSGFDTMASAAFGKKPTRRQEEDSRPPIIMPKRTNDLSSIMDHFLGPSEPSRNYTESALSQRRAAAAKTAEPVKIEDMSWPELAPAPKNATSIAKMPVSFAEMMKKRVAEDEIQAAIEAREKYEKEMVRRQLTIDRNNVFIPPLRRAARDSRITCVDEEEVLESDLDHVAGDDTAGVVPTDTDDYYDDDEEEDRAEDQDEYYRR